jgi:hypothetical protein
MITTTAAAPPIATSSTGAAHSNQVVGFTGGLKRMYSP